MTSPNTVWYPIFSDGSGNVSSVYTVEQIKRAVKKGASGEKGSSL
jgi:hypothetical protein